MMSDEQDSVAKPAGITEEPSRNVGRPTAKAHGKVQWLMELKAFCTQASIIGLRYVVSQTASMFRRSVWLLLLLAGAAFTAQQIVDRTAYYFSYPTNVNMHVEHVPEMRFPTVTICNENKVTLSGATSLGKLPRVGFGAHVCYHCRISPPRFLAECRKRRLNQGFVLLFLGCLLCLICI